MRNAVIASTALMASSALAGTAHVVNACKYSVHMSNTPAQGGGFSSIDQVLSPGGSYSQQWTELDNGMGWSIKLAKQNSFQTDLMQYEYTYHNDGIIWYDLSEVDGNPWDGNWMITASGNGCNPKQQAYRYSTDDAYGMQSCPAASEITVTLCSGESQEDGAASSASEQLSSKIASSTEAASSPDATSSWDEPSSPPATSTTEASQPEKTNSNNGGGWSWGGHHTWQINDKGAVVAAAAASPSPTTLVTKKLSTTNQGGYDVTVTNVETAVVTAYVTAGAKRHEHHPRHPHMKRDE